MTAPNFFLIGAPKCGTTALSEYLRQHPGVFFCTPKEPNYFNRDYADRDTPTLARYLDYFAAAGPGHAAVGEGSTAYLHSAVAVADILAFNPAARFLVMLRNPVETAPACHAQALLNGAEDVADFRCAWELQAQRSAGQRLPRGCREPKHLLYADYCRFAPQIGRLYATVPAAQRKVIVFDDFAADPGRTYDEVLEFLGLAPHRPAEFARVNERRAIRHLQAYRALRYLGRWKRRLFGAALPWGLNRYADRLLTRPATGSHADPATDFLREYFRDDVAQLSALLDRDLRHWTAAPQAKPEPMNTESAGVPA
ncbi:MAG: hypothetical protein A2580_05950 [Hydrogenophilales bacterium RIFOXYD1_FULL_62_11]|nr:MAG: hypothetical protein A2580_05950 [Hydrogenophilales bacterium RIFOXYD1_FULL_62_11]